MILKASQRGGGKRLAAHLLNARDNEHVHVHELRGFTADDLPGAFQEAYAVSRATRAKQFLFSLSLNPPQDKHVAALHRDVAGFDCCKETASSRLKEKFDRAAAPRERSRERSRAREPDFER